MGGVVSQIDSLTIEQKNRFKEFIERWTSVGLSTEPANRKLAEEGVVNAYKIAGKEPPKKIVWCASPLSQGLTRAIVFGLKDSEIKIGKKLKASVRDSVRDSVWASVRDSVRDSVWDSVGASVRDSVGDSVGDSVWASVGDSVRDSVWDSVGASVWDSVWDSVGASVRDSVGASVRDSVRDSVWDSVRASVWDSVRDSVGASVWDSVRDSVWDSVGASVRDSVRDSVGASVWDSAYGSHDANWLGFYDYFKEVCGLEEQTQKLFGIWQVSKNAGWWLPHENICWISERHNVLKRDQQGRLHAEGEMALQYPDKWGIYAFHGVRLPFKYGSLKHEQWQSKWILEEKNAELRRVLIQGIGYGKICRDLKAKSLDSWKEYELLRIDNADVEPILMVKMICPSTGLLHAHRVPPEIKTAREGIRWINNGIDKEEFLVEH